MTQIQKNDNHLNFISIVFPQELAEKEFQNIAEAYEVLSDDEMRKIYDEGGSLAEACCKRKYQQSNEVGEDDDDEEGFFRYLENLFFSFSIFQFANPNIG